MSNLARQIRVEFLGKGVRSARELAGSLGVSQPTISRALADMDPQLRRIGSGRTTRYGLLAPVGDFGSAWPLYFINTVGAPEQIGTLHSLAGPAYWLEGAERWPSLTGEQFATGVFPGLPWFLDDMRPQGFLGRTFARRYGLDLGQGPNPVLWPNSAVIESLLRFGSNLLGAFVLGHHALAGALVQREPFVEAGAREVEYPAMAERAEAGEIVGSSAGGEQPKFLVTTGGPEGARPVLVKFSPSVGDEAGQRWADLLYAEWMAAGILAEYGQPVPRSRIIDAGHRRFLEVERFDRTREGGRVATVSLRALDGAFLGMLGGPWSEAGRRLQEDRWIRAGDAERMASVHRFGQLIANTDMHFGNISFFLSPRRPLGLTPIYDMLPMGYRPNQQNVVPDFSEDTFSPTLGIPSDAPERSWAVAFWERLADAPEVSARFQAIARQHAQRLK